jgi:hypothetical protein
MTTIVRTRSTSFSAIKNASTFLAMKQPTPTILIAFSVTARSMPSVTNAEVVLPIRNQVSRIAADVSSRTKEKTIARSPEGYKSSENKIANR